MLNEVLWRIPQVLTFQQNPSAESRYYNILGTDGNFRRCKPVLAEWLADSTQYSDPHRLEWYFCFQCDSPNKELGDYIPLDMHHHQQDDNLYKMLRDAYTNTAGAELSLCHVDQGFNVFQHFPCIVCELLKTDLLHTMQIGMLDHLRKGIFHFMKTHKLLDKYYAI